MSNRFDDQNHWRKSGRIPGYDYSQAGAYFVTVVAYRRKPLFGEVREGVMQPNHLGEIVQHAWFDLSSHYPRVRLDAFCLMPNHVHGIIVLVNEPHNETSWIGSSIEQDEIVPPTSRGGSSPEANKHVLPARHIQGKDHLPEQTRPYNPTNRMAQHGLPEIVRAFKSFSARRVNVMRRMKGTPVWQRSYYEHILRSEADWRRIAAYILDNPRRWDEDEYHIPLPKRFEQ